MKDELPEALEQLGQRLSSRRETLWCDSILFASTSILHDNAANGRTCWLKIVYNHCAQSYPESLFKHVMWNITQKQLNPVNDSPKTNLENNLTNMKSKENVTI